MLPSLGVDTTYATFYRHPTRHKKIVFLAKIDGQNWYDLSDFVRKVHINNRIEVLQAPAVDEAVVTVANVNNAFTPTQYNDTFNPAVGKLNGTPEQAYLGKVWEVQLFALVSKFDTSGLPLPEESIAYFRQSLVDLLNGIYPNGYTPDGTENYFLIPLFRGWKPADGIEEQHRTANIHLKDMLWITTRKGPENPLLYTGYTPTQILQDILVNRCGFDQNLLDLQQLSTTWDLFVADNTKTWWQILQEITQAAGGKLTCAPNGRICFRTRIENYSDPTPVLTITEDAVKTYTLEKKRQYNRIVVKSEGYKVGSRELVIDHELRGDNAKIQPGTTASFEFEYTSEYIKDPSNYVKLSYANEYGTPLATDATFHVDTSDSYLKLESMSAYPNKLILKIKNLSSVVVQLTHVKFEATPIRKQSEFTITKPNQTDEPDSELQFTSFYSSEALLSNIADVVYAETTKNIRFELQMNEFYPDVFAGNLVRVELPKKGIATGVFLVERVEHGIESKWTTTLTVLEYGDISFQISDKEIVVVNTGIQVPPVESTISDIQQDLQEIRNDVQEVQNKVEHLDGVAPAVPQNLSLATLTSEGRSFVTASWTANTEPDLIGYEIAWSYDGLNWNYIRTADTLVRWEVAGNKTIYVKVRALDAEGKRSNWTTVQTITSARDTIPPAIPTGLTATGLFQTIMVRWNANTEVDFSHYVLQYDTASNFATAKEIRLAATSTVIKDLAVNTTYYIRVKAVDTSGNASNWSSVVSATTAKLDNATYYDYAALKTAVIQGGYIDSAWISELDAGKITTGYLSADRIAAKSLSLEKLVFQPTLSIPEGACAYFTRSLIDEVRGIVPDGFTEINLAPHILLTPENAPPNSVVADLLAGNVIYAQRRIEVGEGADRWAIDGTYGLTRVLNNTDYPLLGMIDSGVVYLDSGDNGKKTIALPYKLSKYAVILNPVMYRYWAANSSTSQNHYMHLSYEDASTSTQTRFTINAYIVRPGATYEQNLNVSIGTSWTTVYTIYGFYVWLRFNAGNLYSVQTYHTYAVPGEYTIRAKYSYVPAPGWPEGYYNVTIEIDFGDGSYDSGTFRLYEDILWITATKIRVTEGEQLPTTGHIQYVVLGY